MDALGWFGLIAVAVMVLSYALEDHSVWFILVFAVACGLGAISSFLHGVWPLGIITAVWAGIALRRFLLKLRPAAADVA
ncbi:hypothetical protein [Rhodopseudomonas telluris]|uniref:DUF4175 domain-containing protein n=1 Tax=Rhodopseudomonas telluris TaxID=644215 RepID=A0ABV6EZ57_9BRAD